MGRISPNKPAASCVGCFAWGQLPGRYCRACYTFGQLHDLGRCTACDREVPVHDGHCRLCRLQASWEAKSEDTVFRARLPQVAYQQLFLAGMHRIRQPGPLLGKRGRRKPSPPPAPVPSHERVEWQQLRLDVTVRRDYSAFDRQQHADLTNPTLAHARQVARVFGETRGWSRWVAKDVDRALVILLSLHQPGDRIRFSELAPILLAHGLSAERTIEVLEHLNLFEDDRTPTLDSWLQRRLGDLAPGIRTDVEDWLRTLHDGGPRTRARSLSTVHGYLNHIDGTLREWSQRFDHLREITRDDVLAAAEGLHGNDRHHTLGALRSLFRHCKRIRSIFRDPTVRIRIGRQDYRVLQPLQPDEIKDAVARATQPDARLALALAAIHATRPTTIRHMRLDDVDLGNRRLTIAGRTDPLDDLTHRALREWLDYRRTRWPHTANPHLIISQQTAVEAGPVGKVWMTRAFRGLTATLERLRMDRQLDEALARGPDPLHLATVFGLDDKTAIRYASAARKILHDPS